MNGCQIISIIFMVVSFGTVLFLARPWEAPRDNKQRWVRSLVTGVFATGISLCLILYSSFSKNTGDCISDLRNVDLAPWACLGILMIIIITVARYIGYGQLIWLRSVRKKMENNKK